MAVVIAIVGIARLLIPYGKALVKVVVNIMVGEKGVDPEDVYAEMDWEQLQPPQQPSDSSSGSRSAFDKFKSERLCQPRALDHSFEVVQASTKQQSDSSQQQQRQTQIAQGPVQKKMEQWNRGQPPRPTEDKADEEDKEIQQIYEQLLNEGLIASKDAGKLPIAPQTQDHNKIALQEPDWWPTTNEQRLQGQLKTSEAIIKQLQDRIPDMENVIINGYNPGQTLMVKIY